MTYEVEHPHHDYDVEAIAQLVLIAPQGAFHSSICRLFLKQNIRVSAGIWQVISP